MDIVTNNGFSQIITKATRIQNNQFSLIDHILTNNSNIQLTGTIISDISDHFITFVVPNVTKTPKTSTTKNVRKFSKNKIKDFKTALNNHSWVTTTSSTDTNEAYENFWQEFKPIYEHFFPEISVQVNKNTHKIKDFFTKELLASRVTKIAYIK
jgi:hypothetical protein